MLTLAPAKAEDVALDAENDEANADDTGMPPQTGHVHACGHLITNILAPSSAMEIDAKKPSKARIGKKRIDKRKQKQSKVVFTKYSDRLAAKKKKSKAAAAAAE